MSLPTVVIVPVADIPAASLPVDVNLDGSGSLPSTGASTITAYAWVLQDKPVGSAANLINSTTATPTLEDVDLVGSYLISLSVTDDLGRESHVGIEPIQSGTVPYGFTFPSVGSMIAIRAVTANAGLVKVAYGERAWLGRGLWELVDEVDSIRGDLDGILGSGVSGDIYTDNIYELTPANDIHAHHPIRVNTIKPRTGATVGVTGHLATTGNVVAGAIMTAVTRVVTPKVKTPVVESDTSLALFSTTNMVVASGGTLQLSAPGVITITNMAGAGDIDVLAATDLNLEAVGEAKVDSDAALLLRSTSGTATLYGDLGVTIDSAATILIDADDDITVNTHNANRLRVQSVLSSRNVTVNRSSGGTAVPNGVESDLPWLAQPTWPAGLALQDGITWDLGITFAGPVLPTEPVTLRMYAESEYTTVPERMLLSELVCNVPTGASPAAFTGPVYWKGVATCRSGDNIGCTSSAVGGDSDLPILKVDQRVTTKLGIGYGEPTRLVATVHCTSATASFGIVYGHAVLLRGEVFV